jgi:hypothetical protein
MSTTLYRAESVIDGWPHRGGMWNGVRVTWFAYRDKPLAPWHKLLNGNYDDPYAQSLADELFTLDETRQLSHYLEAPPHVVNLTVSPVRLPMATISADGCALMGVSAIPFGGSTDAYMLYKHEDYDLPMKVLGYYCMEQEPEPQLVKQRCGHTCAYHGEAPYSDVHA